MHWEIRKIKGCISIVLRIGNRRGHLCIYIYMMEASGLVILRQHNISHGRKEEQGGNTTFSLKQEDIKKCIRIENDM